MAASGDSKPTHVRSGARSWRLADFCPLDAERRVRPDEEPVFSKVSFRGWSVERTELQEFIDTAQASPALFELFSQVLQQLSAGRDVTQGAGASSLEVVNPFLLLQPAKHRTRLQRLTRKAGTIVAPVLRHGADDWLAGTITVERVGAHSQAECVVSHSSELSRGE